MKHPPPFLSCLQAFLQRPIHKLFSFLYLSMVVSSLILGTNPRLHITSSGMAWLFPFRTRSCRKAAFPCIELASRSEQSWVRSSLLQSPLAISQGNTSFVPLRGNWGIYRMSDTKQKETGYLGHQRKMSGGRRDAGMTVLSRTQKHYVWQPRVLDFLGQSQFQLFPHLVRPHIPIFWLEKVTTRSSGHLISTLTQRATIPSSADNCVFLETKAY